MFELDWGLVAWVAVIALVLWVFDRGGTDLHDG